MTLKQALELALKILKQVMEEKLNSSNVEVCKSFSVLFLIHNWKIANIFCNKFCNIVLRQWM